MFLLLKTALTRVIFMQINSGGQSYKELESRLNSLQAELDAQEVSSYTFILHHFVLDLIKLDF